jgi:biopolymer transport protein ExbD
MKFATPGDEPEKPTMNMTPMIDVCFQLIIFFMLSLRLYSPEGDFSVRMPLAAPTQGLPDETQTPPVKIRLRADQNGNLASIQLGQRKLGSFQELQRQIRDIAGLDRGPAGTTSNAEVELDCDYNLKFEYVVSALSAVSGYLAADRQTVVRLIEKIRFAPPRKPGGG